MEWRAIAEGEKKKKVKLEKMIDGKIRIFFKVSIQFVTCEFSCSRDKLLRSLSGSSRRDRTSNAACQTTGMHLFCYWDHGGENLEKYNVEKLSVLL